MFDCKVLFFQEADMSGEKKEVILSPPMPKIYTVSIIMCGCISFLTWSRTDEILPSSFWHRNEYVYISNPKYSNPNTESTLAFVRASTDVQVAKLQGECGTVYKVVAGNGASLHPYCRPSNSLKRSFNSGCSSIASAAHITQAQLLALNPGLNSTTLPIGTDVCLGLPCSKTYLVAPGDWCAKIKSSQGVSEAVLMSSNPGLSCTYALLWFLSSLLIDSSSTFRDIFQGQRLCVAAPSSPPSSDPSPSDPIPTLPPPLPEPVVPSVPCKTEIAVTLGDICYDLATNYGLQLNQFMALNSKINCSNLQPGDIVCILPACGEIYRVSPIQITSQWPFCT